MPFKLAFAELMEIPTVVHDRLKPVRLKKALTKVTYHSLSKKCFVQQRESSNLKQMNELKEIQAQSS